ncbi:MAG: cysteine--tRNA ligase [Candidatus Omnitrophota bacterium]
MSQPVSAIHFHNTESNRKEPFQPLEPGKVRMYTCGPTVYNYAHIGNYRAYLFEDLLRRYLKYRGFQVNHIMNITDVEDKIIRESGAKNVSIFEYVKPFIQAFFEDLDVLNVERAEHYPHATDFIPQMTEIIRVLRDKGYTYERNGSIYFKISQFEKYGRLSGVKPDGVMSGARVDSDEYEKEDARDFVLWKARKEGEHFWTTEFGEGRPGWHIECSAMSMHYLGEQLDIHCGGEDNIFPHHENEIAQSEAMTGKPFVRYWLHCRHLLVNGEKMSKSKGNFFTLRDLLVQGHHPMAIRYFIVASHYRSPINLSEEALKGAHSAWSRIMDFRNRMKETIEGGENGVFSQPLEAELQTCMNRFEERMDDDLDSPRAAAAVFDFIREANKIFDDAPIAKEQAQKVLEAMNRIDSVFGVAREDEAVLNEDIDRMIQERQEARKRKDFAAADAIRDRLTGMGIILEDTREGVRWKRR